MNKILIAFAVTGVALGTFAGPRGHGCGHRPPPPPAHCYGGWGRGGRNFWPGFFGGVIGGLTYNAFVTPVCREPVVVQTTPTVVTQPVVVQQPAVVTQPVVIQQPVVQSVWVPGQYVDQVQTSGLTVRTWVPGHYEQRTVQ